MSTLSIKRINYFTQRVARKAKELGLFQLLAYAIVYFSRKVADYFYQIKSKCKTAYFLNRFTSLTPHIDETLKDNNDFFLIPDEVIQSYLKHRFDLLGSGWVIVKYGTSCRGIEQYSYSMGCGVEADKAGKWLVSRINFSNSKISQKIWQLICSPYQPIDWQLDFKSGFRWSEKTWFKKIKHSHQLGVDIKVPWELARMQHLPQLACAYVSSSYSRVEKEVIKKEFRNQLIDFIATNPPGYGVNWVCPMDVAIRAVNILVARDIFRVSQADFDDAFEKLLANSIYAHGRFIVNNLEWNPKRANHYLSNIAGLAFIAAYLPQTEEIDLWLAYAIQELIVEVGHQFHSDGGNFEGSTAYHCLSAEIVFYTTALIIGLPNNRLEQLKECDHKKFKNKVGFPSLKKDSIQLYGLAGSAKKIPFSSDFFKSLERMAEFIMAITKPDGHILQVGDNDSGRFVNLSPVYKKSSVKYAKKTFANLKNYSEMFDDEEYYLEDRLNYQHVIVAAYALFGRGDFAQWLEKKGVFVESRLDYRVFRSLLKEEVVRTQTTTKSLCSKASIISIGEEKALLNQLKFIETLSKNQFQKYIFSIPEEINLNDLTIKKYSDFGLYIMCSKRLFISIRCCTLGKNIHRAHRHFDQLSMELSVDDKDLIYDPGTYIYTPIPKLRFLYQCHNSHFSPISNAETQEEGRDIFYGADPEEIEILYFGNKGFSARTTGLNIKQLIVVLQDSAVIVYHVDKQGINKRKQEDYLNYSPGYGQLLMN